LGHVYVQVSLRGPKKAKSVRMLVHTGTAYLMIPPRLADELGSFKLPGMIPTSYANGGREELEATAVMIELEGRVGGAIALIRASDEPLLGVEALEALGLKVDPDYGKGRGHQGVRGEGVVSGQEFHQA